MLFTPIDNILVEKAKRQMHLRSGENIVKGVQDFAGQESHGR